MVVSRVGWALSMQGEPEEFQNLTDCRTLHPKPLTLKTNLGATQVQHCAAANQDLFRDLAAPQRHGVDTVG